MLYPILFFSELFVLFLLSNSLTRHISSFLFHVTKSKRITIVSMAFLFFPGTLIHELSHYLAAKLLFVPTYTIEFFPKLYGETLKLGSVSIAKSDFLRQLLIGMAPFFVGTILLLGTLFYAAQQQLFKNIFFIILIGYIVFEIGNTMFSSKKDMEGAIELLLTLSIILSGLYVSGINFPIDIKIFFENRILQQAFEKGSIFLLAPLSINIILISCLKVIKK